MIALDPIRIRRRAKALLELRQHGEVYWARCERQGYPVTTSPQELARHEIAHEMQVEALAVVT